MENTMCTAEEAYEQSVQAVEHVLFSKENGKTRLEIEIESALFRGLGKWLVGGGAVIIVAVAGIYFNVQENTKKIDKALTQDQAALIIQRLDSLKESVDEKNARIDSIDSRLRSAGY